MPYTWRSTSPGLRGSTASLLLLQRVNGEVQVCSELARCRQLQVTRHTHSVPQIAQAGDHRASVQSAFRCARRSQRRATRLLGLHPHQQRMRHVPQRCREEEQAAARAVLTCLIASCMVAGPCHLPPHGRKPTRRKCSSMPLPAVTGRCHAQRGSQASGGGRPGPGGRSRAAPASTSGMNSSPGTAVGSQRRADTGRAPRWPTPLSANLVTASRFWTSRAAACRWKEAAAGGQGPGQQAQAGASGGRSRANLGGSTGPSRAGGTT